MQTIIIIFSVANILQIQSVIQTKERKITGEQNSSDIILTFETNKLRLVLLQSSVKSKKTSAVELLEGLRKIYLK